MNTANKPIQEIIPGLFLGSCSAGFSLPLLEEHGISHIVALGDFEPLHQHITYKNIRVLDLIEENIIQYFPETYEFIKDALASKGRVLVHCQAGVSRSPTIVAAYMMREKQLSAQQALDIIKLRRAIIEPNRGFLEQLNLYHELRYNVDQTEAAYRRFLVAANARAQQEYGCIQNLALSPDPELAVGKTKSKLILRCKKCRRVLVDDDCILDHQPGPGQQAFSYTKRSAELNVTAAPTAAAAAPSRPLNPLLASIAASNNQCSSYFIEPMEWIASLQDGLVEGRIDCPKCYSKLGQYNWAGAQCSCGRWITPAFMLHRKQVDQVKTTAQ
ncbi:hypothetical protein VTP01DRAFT_2041 [Rhizomucor pusillus]|uniref:uncharacterized protein n=1 Tax=Rhizomucor pusillus TaxID=4840 RepID=UPI0037442F8F